jgi:hypothetical protein
VHVIEINDTGIAVSHGERVLLESPGYAVVDGNQILVGEAAMKQSRLNPRASYDQFWEQLSLEALPKRHVKVQHHADLAYQHLSSLWAQVEPNPGEVIFAVPGSFNTQQLSLLLGIAKACAIPAIGLVDAATAAASTTQAAGKVWHLDAQLHRIVLTKLDASTNLARTSVHDVARRGLVALREAWANAIADAFLREARFDPMHRAESEQALYDSLPGWLACFKEQSSAVLNFKTRHRTHRLSLQRVLLIEAAAGLYQEVANNIRGHLHAGEPGKLLVSHRLHELPGALEALGCVLNCKRVPLERNATARGAVMHAAHIRSSGETLNFVTRLPLRAPVVETAVCEERTATVSRRPTHVLHRGRAYPITDEPLIAGAHLPAGAFGIALNADYDGRARCSIRQHGGAIVIENLSSGEGIAFNGRKLRDRMTGQIGDIIRIGEAELQLIAVVNHDGA